MRTRARLSSTPPPSSLTSPCCVARGLASADSQPQYQKRRTKEMSSNAIGGAEKMDSLGIEPRASRMLSGCDTTTPTALLGRGQQQVSHEAANNAIPKLSAEEAKSLTISNTVAILAQGTHWAVATSQAFLATKRAGSNPDARQHAKQKSRIG